MTGFVDCFNRQAYFEAHEVLEGLWMKTTGESRDLYKGLIQTAAVFLKLQQGKPEPAIRLARRAASHLHKYPPQCCHAASFPPVNAASHLHKYPPQCEGVRVERVLAWLDDVIRGRNLVAEGNPPHLELLDS